MFCYRTKVEMISCHSSFTNIILTLKTCDFLPHYCGKSACVLPILLVGHDLNLVLESFALLIMTEVSLETAEDLCLVLILEWQNMELMELRALTEAVFLYEINSVLQVSDQNPADVSLR